MYIYLTKINKSIIDGALKLLNIKSEEYIETIKGDECIKTDNLIEIIESLIYEMDRINEKLEDMNERNNI